MWSTVTAAPPEGRLPGLGEHLAVALLASGDERPVAVPCEGVDREKAAIWVYAYAARLVGLPSTDWRGRSKPSTTAAIGYAARD